MTAPTRDDIALLSALIAPADLRVDDYVVEPLSLHPLVRRFQMLDAAQSAFQSLPAPRRPTGAGWYLDWLQTETAGAIMQDEQAMTAVMEIQGGDDWSKTLPGRIMRALQVGRAASAAGQTNYRRPIPALMTPVNANAIDAIAEPSPPVGAAVRAARPSGASL